MLIDTHCHIPMIIDENINKIFTPDDYEKAEQIIADASLADVKKLITIGSTSHNESINCSSLVTNDSNMYLLLLDYFRMIAHQPGLHDLKALIPLIKSNDKIVAIGECGLDFHYPNFIARSTKRFIQSTN